MNTIDVINKLMLIFKIEIIMNFYYAFLAVFYLTVPFKIIPINRNSSNVIYGIFFFIFLQVVYINSLLLNHINEVNDINFLIYYIIIPLMPFFAIFIHIKHLLSTNVCISLKFKYVKIIDEETCLLYGFAIGVLTSIIINSIKVFIIFNIILLVFNMYYIYYFVKHRKTFIYNNSFIYIDLGVLFGKLIWS